MVKITNQSVPAELEDFYRRGVVNREVRNIDTAGRKVFQDSRKNLTQLADQSLIYEIAREWGLLDSATKILWDDASESNSGARFGYQLFVQDYSFRKSVGMSLPGNPNLFHQLKILRVEKLSDDVCTSGYSPDVLLDDPVTLTFNYRVQRVAPLDNSYLFAAVSYIHWVGGDYQSGIGWLYLKPVDDEWYSAEIVTTGDPPYFHWESIYFIPQGVGTVGEIDDIVVTTNGVEIYRQKFNNDPLVDWWYHPDAPPSAFSIIYPAD